MTDTAPARMATFTRMDESTAEEWQIIMAEHVKLNEALADQVLAQMRLLDSSHGGFAVDRLTHSLQTAHRAEADNRDDAYVICALIHDIGDVLAPDNHESIAAGILQPYVSEAYHWMIANHGVFQGYYFWHHLGGDRNARERYAGHEHYDLCAEFCHEYDMPAFDPHYPTPPLEHYEPLVREFFAPKPH